MKRKFPEPHAGSQNAEFAKIGKRLTQLTNVLPSGVDSLAPWLNDCRTDHFANVEFTCEVTSESVTLLLIHAVLEERAENFRAHFAPIVVTRRVVQSVQLRPL